MSFFPAIPANVLATAYYCFQIVSKIPVIGRVSTLAMAYFSPLQAFFMGGYGAKIWTLDSKRVQKGEQALRINGQCMCAGGITGLFYFVYSKTAIAPLLQTSTSGFFIASNIAAIIYNMDLFRTAQEQSEQDVHRFPVMNSACLGIISNLAYMIAGLMTIFSIQVALIIVFAGVGVSTGCIKFLYDYMHRPNLKT